jgi:hypothetical protein
MPRGWSASARGGENAGRFSKEKEGHLPAFVLLSSSAKEKKANCEKKENKQC